MRHKDSAEVIVAGGGPVGMFLAAELRRYGVSVTVIERLGEPSHQIKAGTVGAQTALTFDQRDLLDAFPQPDWAALFGTSDPEAPPRPVGHFAGLWLLRGAPGLTAGPVLAPQFEVEAVLEERARALGVTVLRSHELVGYVDDGERIVVRVTGPGGDRTLTGRFLVGADGGRSRVRKQTGVAFDGSAATITGRQALVDLADPHPLERGWHRTERGMVVFGPDPHRILTVEFHGPPTDREAPVTAAEIEASLSRVSGRAVSVTALHSGTRWTDNTRVARDYRIGRVLLAGDAAHVHPPFGGQGLNLGLQDAVNLGWKLAAVLRGTAPDSLLDTYTAERRPAAEAALTNTRAQVALMRPDPQTTALRDLFADLMALDDANAHVSTLMSGLDRPYAVGSDFPGAGAIVTDRPIGQTRLYELLRTPGGLLVDTTADGRLITAAGGWSDRVRSVHDPDGPSSLLVRPDGVLAWESGTPERGGEGLVEALAAWFGALELSTT